MVYENIFKFFVKIKYELYKFKYNLCIRLGTNCFSNHGLVTWYF